MQRQQQLQEQMNQQLQPISGDEMQKRMKQLQMQINQQVKPLKDALNSIAQEGENLQRMTVRMWLKPVLISVLILLSISLPAWGLMQYLLSEVQNNLQLIQQQKQTLMQIQAKTWGVELHQDQTGRYLIMPPGVEPSTGWTVGKRQAVKLGKN